MNTVKETPEVVDNRMQRRGDNSGSQRTADALFMIALIAIATVYISSRRNTKSQMSEKVVDSAEVELYLTPGGAYTDADIVANGNQTASKKFKSFQAKHDFSPKVGDAICPITQTKANPACGWIIGGNEYLFCCPPCIDEFLVRAKSNPTSIETPSYYVHGLN